MEDIKKPSENIIHLFKENLEIKCPEESTILDATLEVKLNHAHACGGQGKCSTCRVSVMEGLENCSPRNEAESMIANKLRFPNQIRLACQTKLHGDISIRRLVSDKMDIDIIVEQVSGGSNVALGSQQKVTIVFTDIVNYTQLAEQFPPYDIVHVLNRYYKIMNSIIVENNGIISDVAGDGILSVFGIDSKKNNSVQDAINAIEGMKEKLVIFNEYLNANFNMKFGIRAGVHYGHVIVGPFDTGAMKKMAVIGDNVNYASRIESANKDFGTSLLLSEEAYHQVKSKYPKSKEFETTLKGKSGKYILHELSAD